MLPECEPSPVQAGVLLSPSQPLPVGNILSGEIPDFTEKFYTTVVIKSTKDHLVLPHNAKLGSIQPMTLENDKVFLRQLILLLIYQQVHGWHMPNTLIIVIVMVNFHLLQDLKLNQQVPLPQVLVLTDPDC